MNIVLIGSGNVAFHLAKAFCQNGVSISQIAARNIAALQEIHSITKYPYTSDIRDIAMADLYIIAVKDDAIAQVASKIPNQNAIVIHTAGSVSYNAIPNTFRRGVLYPLQSFSKKKNLNYKEIPILVETEHDADTQIVTNIAQKISDKVSVITEKEREQIHLAAVFACNFTNHMLTIANEICEKNNIPFQYLQPLIEETIEKIKTIPPIDAQTGPAARNDKTIIQKHTQMIDGDIQKIYLQITNSIIQYNKKNK